MKSIRFLLASFFAMLCVFTLAFAGDVAVGESLPVTEVTGKAVNAEVPKVETTESFIAHKGFTLWKYAIIEQKLPLKDWEKYFADAKVLNSILTDDGWRNIPIGTRITVPRSPFAIIADQTEQEHAQFVAELTAMRAELVALQKNLADLEVLLEEATTRNFKLFLGTLVLFFILAVLTCWLVYTKWILSEKTTECERLEKELRGERKDPDRFVFPTRDSLGSKRVRPVVVKCAHAGCNTWINIGDGKKDLCEKHASPTQSFSSDRSSAGDDEFPQTTPLSDAPCVANDVQGEAPAQCETNTRCGTCGDDTTTEKSQCPGESCGGCPSCDGACSSKSTTKVDGPVDPR